MARDIREWLGELGLGTENEIGIGALPHLREDDLRELGLPMGPRKMLLAAIAELETVEATQSHDALTAQDAERRQLTVMFCDLVGSTTLSQKLDPPSRHAGFCALPSGWRSRKLAAPGAARKYNAGHVAVSCRQCLEITGC